MKRTFPLATLVLIVLVVAVFALEVASGDPMALCRTWGFAAAHPSLVTALTSLALHDPANWLHIAGNLAVLAIFGVVVEGEIGGLGLLMLFVASGLGAAAMHWLVNPAATTTLVGCSGAVFGVMAVAGVLRPRLLGFVLALGAINVWHAFTGGDGAVSFGAHLGGLVVGVAFAAIARASGAGSRLAWA